MYAGNKLESDGWNVGYVQGIDGTFIKATVMICTCPLLHFFQYAYIPRGFFINYDNKKDIQNFSSLLRKHLKKQNVIYLEIDPNILYHKQDKKVKLSKITLIIKTSSTICYIVDIDKYH